MRTVKKNSAKHWLKMLPPRSLLIKAANIINSRSLTPQPKDPSDYEPITSNHFFRRCSKKTIISSSKEVSNYTLSRPCHLLGRIRRCAHYTRTQVVLLHLFKQHFQYLFFFFQIPCMSPFVHNPLQK